MVERSGGSKLRHPILLVALAINNRRLLKHAHEQRMAERVRTNSRVPDEVREHANERFYKERGIIFRLEHRDQGLRSRLAGWKK